MLLDYKVADTLELGEEINIYFFGPARFVIKNIEGDAAEAWSKSVFTRLRLKEDGWYCSNIFLDGDAEIIAQAVE